MASNSSKFFCKNILLTTVSGAALLLDGGNAFAAAARAVIAANADLAGNVGLDVGGAFVADSTLQFDGAFDIAEANIDILALDMNGKAGGPMVVTQSISLGSAVDTGGINKLAVTVNDTKALTLTGTGSGALNFQNANAAAADIYTALGNITLTNAGVLTVNSATPALITLTGNIDGTVANNGTATFTTDSQIDGTIGAIKSLLAVNVGASTATLGGAVLNATNFNLSKAASILTLTNAAAVLTGNVDNTTTVDDQGTLNLNGAASTVSGKIGNSNSLFAVNVGAGTATLGGTVIKADTINLSKAASVLTLTSAGANLTGSIVNTAADNNGIVNLNGTINIKGHVGIVDALNTINVAALGAVEITGSVNTTNFVMQGDATTAVEVMGLLTGNVTFTGNKARLAPNGGITGNLTVSNGGIVIGVGRNVTGSVVLQADSGAVTIQDVLGVGNNVTVAGGTLNLKNAINNVTVTGGTVTQTGTVGGNLAVSNNAIFNGGVATDVTGTVKVGGTAQVTIHNATNAAAVEIAGGTLNITNANKGINFVAGAVAETTVNVAAGGDVKNVNNTTGGDGVGILNFLDAGTAGKVGNANTLNEVNLKGAAEVTLGAVKATNIKFAAAATFIATGNVTANIDFQNNAGIVVLRNGLTITGTIGSTGGPNGKIGFIGNGKVTETIGGAGGINKISLIRIAGDDTKIVFFDKDVYTNTLEFHAQVGGPASTVKIGGNLTGNVTFDNVVPNNGGTLEFNGAGANYTFAGAITNPDNGKLTVDTALLTATDASVGTIQNITINDTKTLILDASIGNIKVLANAGNTIKLDGANSTLTFANKGDRANATVELGNDIKAVVGNGGKFALLGGVQNALTVSSDDPNIPIELGAAAAVGDKLTSLTVANKVTITPTINASGILELNVVKDATFTDQSTTTASIPIINIGAAGGAGAGSANHIIDVSTAAGDTNLLAAINFVDDDSVLTLQNTAAANKKIILGRPLDPGKNNSGILTLNAADAGGTLTITGGSIGVAGNEIKKLNLDGKGKFDLTGAPLFVAEVDLGVGEITLDGISGNLTFSADTKLTENGNIAGSVNFNNQAAIINMANNTQIGGGVTNGVNAALNFVGGGSVGGVIESLGTLKVGAGDVKLIAQGDYSITNIEGTGTNTLTLPENFKLTGSINNGVGLPVKLNFTGGTNSVSGVVGTAANPVGNITTNGTTSFASSVNSNGIVTLSPGSVNTFANDTTATSVVASEATLAFTNKLAFNSALTGSGTTINLNAAPVSYTGQSSFSGKLIIATSYDQAKNSGGNIVITSGSKMDLSSLDELEIQFNGTDVHIREINENTKYSLISSEDGNGLVPLPADKIKFFIDSNDNSFIKWSINTSSLTLSATNITNEILQKEINDGSFTPEEAQDIATLIRAPEDTDTDTFRDEFGFFTIEQQKETLDRATPDMVRPGVGITAVNTQVVYHSIVGNLSSLDSRINKVQTSQNKVAVSAGDETEVDFGAWASPFVGNSTQKARNNLSGYKSNSTGGTVGFDSLVGDDFLLGVAYTRADTKIKQKNNNVGDKSKVQSNIYSLYGLYNVPNKNWFFEGIASYGDSKVKNYSQRNIALGRNLIGYETATGKYKSRSYTGQILAGYSYLAPKAINLTPTVGIRYSGIKDSGYTETGTTFQNLIVKGKKYNTIEGLAGITVSKDINVENVVLTPAIYGMLDYNFKGKTPAIDARLQGMDSPFTTNSFKPAKTSFNFGVGVTAKHQMMEYGVNYDANVASRYFAQQGSLKVRVNF